MGLHKDQLYVLNTGIITVFRFSSVPFCDIYTITIDFQPNEAEVFMARRFTREEILARLRSQIQRKKPILIFGAGSGLTAKSAEVGGADIIAVYSTAIYRMRGLPSLLAFLPYSDANAHAKNMAAEILPAVKDTPCIVGIGAHDLTLNQEKFMEDMLELGFSGFTNEPFVGIYGSEFAAQLESVGIGFSQEVAMIRHAHKKQNFTLAWVFSPGEAKIMVEAGSDMVGAHLGVTAGGLTGAKETMDLKSAIEAVKEMCDAARSVNPAVLVITHGGPFKDPASAELSIRGTGAVGYASGSSGERLPTEQAITEITRRYKTMKTSEQ